MSFYTDEDVAELLARDAARRSELWKDIGTKAYQGRILDPPGTREVNKRFLQNTILSVETHNRREEVEDCWRQHKLTKRLDKSHHKTARTPITNVNYDNEREYWAEQKKRKLEEVTQLMGDNIVETEREIKKAKKSKEKKKKKDKKEKKKKKKRETKSRSRNSDSDNSSISS